MAGRKTKYQDDYARQVGVWCEQFGATDAQLAKALNVSVATLNSWKHEHPEFLESLKAGKLAHDAARIEASIAKCAEGFYYVREEWDASRKNADGTTGAIVRLWEFYAPAYKQQLLWMHNRQGWSCPAPPRVNVAAVSAGEAPALGDGDGSRWTQLAEDLKDEARQVLQRRYKTRLRLPAAKVIDVEHGDE